MPPIDLTPQDLDIVREILARYVPGRPVWAFGSRVTGRARRHSDLDLLIDAQELEDPARLGELLDAFSLSDLPFRVDVVLLRRLAPEFAAQVLAQRVALP